MSNHLYWPASSTPEVDGEVVLAKWLSIVNHMHNIHTDHSEKFPFCVHSDLGEAGRRKKSLQSGNFIYLIDDFKVLLESFYKYIIFESMIENESMSMLIPIFQTKVMISR